MPAWQKGESGNKNGRPKGLLTAEIAAAARDHAPEAIEKLVVWMRSDDHRASIPAITELLNRGYGKAPQEIIGLDGDNLDLRVTAAARLAQMSDEEFDAFDSQFRQVVGNGVGDGEDQPRHDSGAEPAPSGESPP